MRADQMYHSIPRMALLNGERFDGDVAVLDGNTSLTFREVAERMTVVGQALLAEGVGPGDRVAVWAPNSAEWITIALGILGTGARLVPLNTRFKGSEAAYVLQKTGARTLFCANGFLGFDYLAMLREADPSVPALADTILLGDRTDGPPRRSPRRGPSTSSSRARPAPTGQSSARGWNRSARRTRATSSSRRARPAIPRGSCSGTEPACGATRPTTGVPISGAATGS